MPSPGKYNSLQQYTRKSKRKILGIRSTKKLTSGYSLSRKKVKETNWPTYKSLSSATLSKQIKCLPRQQTTSIGCEETEGIEHVLLECETLTRCRHWTMGYPSSKWEDFRRDPTRVVRGFTCGICLLRLEVQQPIGIQLGQTPFRLRTPPHSSDTVGIETIPANPGFHYQFLI